MKTKFILFLTLTLALLSIFAVSVSAEVPEWTAMQYLDDMADKATFGEDGTKATATSRVMLSHEVTDETTGETTIVYTTYPAYYICKDSTSLTMNYTEINKYAGVTYAAANVVRLEIPKGTVTLPDEVLRASKGYTALQTVVIPEGVTTIGGFVFKVKDNETNTSLISVDIPSTVTSIGEDAFYRCLYLTKLIIPEGVTTIPGQMAFYAGSITELYIPSTVTSIGSQAFYRALDGVEIVLPEKLKTLGEYAFKYSGATEVSVLSNLQTVEEGVFDSCSQLASVYCKSETVGVKMFANCPSLKTVRLENTVSIGSDAFYAASTSVGSITSLNLPDTITSIGDYAFARAKITSVVIPAGLTTIGLGIFKQCIELESAVILCSSSSGEMFQNSSKLSKLVFTESFDTLGSGAFSNIASSSTIFYTGSDYERMKTLMSGLNRVSQAKFSSYENYKAGTHTTGTYMFIYEANLCEVGFDSNHVYTGKITPSFAGEKFLSECSFGDLCTRCNEGQIIETLPALFISKGYSHSEDAESSYSLLQGFGVNRELISKYEAYLGDIKFGLIAAYCGTSADGFDTTSGNLINANGQTVNTKVAHVDFTERGYDLFEMKITGLSSSHLATSFYINGYIIANDTVYYIDDQKTTATAVSKTYNSVAGIE